METMVVTFNEGSGKMETAHLEVNPEAMEAVVER
jgi:hypothetical protein